MPTRRNKPTAPPPSARLSPTPAQKLVHGLGNSLSAARLRLGVVIQDPACQRTQKANLEALLKILGDAADDTTRLDDLLWNRPPAD